MIPDVYNPVDLDRYAYVRNNPVNFNDPTGHFTDDAISDYLKNIYGDEWIDVWKKWSNDDELMNLLHKAQAGDVLSRSWFDSDGKGHIDHYQFTGEGETKLDGLRDWATVLDRVISESSGLVVTRWTQWGPEGMMLSEIAQKGNLHVSVRKTSVFDSGVTSVFIGVSTGGVAALLGYGTFGLGSAVVIGAANFLFGLAPGSQIGDLLVNFMAQNVMGFVNRFGQKIPYGPIYAQDFILRNGGIIYQNHGYYINMN